MEAMMCQISKLMLFLLISYRIQVVNSKTCAQNDRILQCNYFPADIPDGIYEVDVVDFMSSYERLELKSTMFQSGNWSEVTKLKIEDNTDTEKRTLYFTERCFEGLTSLKQIEIHILQDFALHANTFIGLNNVSSLDISGSGRLRLEVLIDAVKSSEVLNLLEDLNISRLKYKITGITLADPFWKAFKHKKLKRLTVTSTAIFMLRPYLLPHYLPTLEVFNISYSDISDGDFPGKMDLSNLNMLDLASVDLPKLAVFLPPKNLIFSQIDLTAMIKGIFERNNVKNYLTVQGLNISDVLKDISVRFIECFAKVDYAVPSNLRELVVSMNNLKRLDVNISGGHLSTFLKILDMSGNGLEFLHPTLLSVFPNLNNLDLSRNKLNEMAIEDIVLFEKLLKQNTVLRYIDFSQNGLRKIPKNMFTSNVEVEIINLANNDIDQVTFLLHTVGNLKYIDLRRNNILYLNENSMINLDHLLKPPRKSNGTYKRDIVDIRYNPISCSQCETKHFFQWMSESPLIAAPDAISCQTEKGNLIGVLAGGVEEVTKICTRRIFLISVSVSISAIAVIIVVLCVAVYRYKKHKLKLKNRDHVFEQLKKGQGHFQFAVFLSFCSSDEPFVSNLVTKPLNRTMKEITGIDRDLVCIGDRDFRPGFFILDETLNGIERSSAIIAIVSDEFCVSDYCNTELDQAYRQGKPILLMLKGVVNEPLMSPSLMFLYKQYVRILWKEENGQYVLKTSWENVCESIIDLIVQNL